MTTSPDTLVLHPGGALGDAVLLWPALRALLAAGRRVALVSADSRARLAHRILGTRPIPDHLPPWSALWTGLAPAEPLPDVSFALATGERPEHWRLAFARLCPRAELRVEPRTLDRPLALELARSLGPLRLPVPLANPAGPIALHVGAGSPAKQWPLHAWLRLADTLAARGRPTLLLAGEVEAELWTADQADLFHRAGGRLTHDLPALADLLGASRACIAADTGPGHLAAQLGLPTLSLFGPTDPARWAPIGPVTAHLVAPSSRLDDLTPNQVLHALDRLLDTPHPPRAKAPG